MCDPCTLQLTAAGANLHLACGLVKTGAGDGLLELTWTSHRHRFLLYYLGLGKGLMCHCDWTEMKREREREREGECVVRGGVSMRTALLICCDYVGLQLDYLSVANHDTQR